MLLGSQGVVLLPVAARLIYPLRGHPRLNPVWASLAMAMSSLSVICASLVMGHNAMDISCSDNFIEYTK